MSGWLVVLVSWWHGAITVHDLADVLRWWLWLLARDPLHPWDPLDYWNL